MTTSLVATTERHAQARGHALLKEKGHSQLWISQYLGHLFEVTAFLKVKNHWSQKQGNRVGKQPWMIPKRAGKLQVYPSNSFPFTIHRGHTTQSPFLKDLAQGAPKVTQSAKQPILVLAWVVISGPPWPEPCVGLCAQWAQWAQWEVGFTLLDSLTPSAPPPTHAHAHSHSLALK